jgi:hypothetical protein
VERVELYIKAPLALEIVDEEKVVSAKSTKAVGTELLLSASPMVTLLRAAPPAE